MAWCPHCDMHYDEDNDSQSGCVACGHPFTCECLQTSYYSTSYSTTHSILKQLKFQQLLYKVFADSITN